jgi:hypothetical protein
MDTNEHTDAESTIGVGDRLELLVNRLRSLPRYDVGYFDEGDGHMCSFSDQSEDGDWISAGEFDKLMKEFDVSNPVHCPSHYTSHPSGVECITVTEHMGFCLGNAIKYIWRADLKDNAIEDLEKARWYIEREIAKRKAPSDKDNTGAA